MLKPAKRYCSRKAWSSGGSLLKKVSLKLPSILTPQAAQDIAVVCIDNPQEGHDDDSNFLAIITNISISNGKVKNNLEKIEKIPIIFDILKRTRKPVYEDLQENEGEIVRKFKKNTGTLYFLCSYFITALWLYA